MSKEVMIVAVFGIVGSFSFLSILAREMMQSRSVRRPVQDPAMSDIARQLAELQQTVDATAIEVERLGEGLRFTTKLLTERSQVPESLRQPEKVITPH